VIAWRNDARGASAGVRSEWWWHVKQQLEIAS
jgi:hypothetical protein